MKIIHLPFSEESIFKYKDKYYGITKPKSSHRCDECPIINTDLCNEENFEIVCNSFVPQPIDYYEILFKEKTNEIIEFPLEDGQVFEYLCGYYTLVESDDCGECAFYDDDCDNLGFSCSAGFVFEEVVRKGKDEWVLKY